MPKLARFDNLVYDSHPYLSTKQSFTPWQIEAWLSRLLESGAIDVKEVFDSQTKLAYFVEFLESCGPAVLQSSTLANRLLEIADQAVAELGLAVKKPYSLQVIQPCYQVQTTLPVAYHHRHKRRLPSAFGGSHAAA